MAERCQVNLGICVVTASANVILQSVERLHTRLALGEAEGLEGTSHAHTGSLVTASDSRGASACITRRTAAHSGRRRQ